MVPSALAGADYRFYKWRRQVAAIFDLRIYLRPLVPRLQGAPLIQFDIPERRFWLFGQVFGRRISIISAVYSDLYRRYDCSGGHFSRESSVVGYARITCFWSCSSGRWKISFLVRQRKGRA